MFWFMVDGPFKPPTIKPIIFECEQTYGPCVKSLGEREAAAVYSQKGMWACMQE